MKAAIVFLAFLAVGYAAQESFEGINVNDYKDENRLDQLLDCIEAVGPCDKLDAVFKARGSNIVKTDGAESSKKEKRITRDLLSLIANDNPANLHTVLKVFDPTLKNSKSFLLSIRDLKSLAGIPKIPRDIIDQYPDSDGHKFPTSGSFVEKYGPRSKFVKRGGVVGVLRRLLRGILGVVGI